MTAAPEPHDPADWRPLAACRGMGPGLFVVGRGEPCVQAKAVCAECPVREPCLEEAIANGERFGVWGGLSERERRRLRDARGLSRTRSSGSAVAHRA